MLTENNIDWVFLESNASIMRIFDKYRIDDKNVRRLHRMKYTTDNNFSVSNDDLSGLDEVLALDKLPRVIYIEPRFSDAPPLKKAYDNLAPTDVSHGQEFIGRVCNRLFASKHWKELSLLITYDEHGGFFDHVPPPGTPNSAAGITVPKIYHAKDENELDGPEFMGVRVPALLVSPFVSGEKSSHVIFDHTSIIKTILVHNRKKFSPQTMMSFGDRVKVANHLGQAFDLDTPRSRPAADIQSLYKEKTTPDPGKKTFYDKKNIAADDFHECLRTLFMR